MKPKLYIRLQRDTDGWWKWSVHTENGNHIVRSGAARTFFASADESLNALMREISDGAETA